MPSLVLRRDIYEQHPFVATSLLNALCDAKAIAAEMRYPRHAALYSALAAARSGRKWMNF